MDGGWLDAAWQALVIMSDPYRLFVLSAGVLMGLVLGIIPGIGGMAGTALLLPFTFSMDPYTAFAFLLGLGAVTATGDPIPAILFGVPGGAGSAATVLDGLPMAKRGEAGRALSAAYMSSLIGGVFGAAFMAFSLPILKPLVLFIGSPELLAFSVFGISMVAILSGNAPLRGLAAACLGIMLAMVGTSPQTGTERWTFHTIYLFDGLPIVPVVLGLFALPELCDLLISRTAISGAVKYDARAGMLKGAQDCFRHWWLVLRCSWLGAGFGAIPGIGGAVIDWLAYGHALRTEKGAKDTFGKGDVRGVIASESSNNAKEAGALVPTVAFGVPGSSGMAILLAAFLIHGLVPGPDMLTTNLKFTYSMVWSIALANVLGAGLCYLFSGQFARLATLRYTLILPSVLGIIYIGAFEGSRSWGDLYALLFFGVLGWTMKKLRWARPPLILGFVLGELIERYLFISINRYGLDWFARPLVVILVALALISLLRPFLEDVRSHGGLKRMLSGFGPPVFRGSHIFYVVVIGMMAFMLMEALAWRFAASVVPIIVASAGIAFAGLSLLNQVFPRPVEEAVFKGEEAKAKVEVSRRIHMDITHENDDIPERVVYLRALVFFGWMVAFMVSMATIGLIPTVPLFVVGFMRMENREPWRLVVPQAVGLTAFIYVVFDQLLTIPWPPTVVGGLAPVLKFIPSV